MRASKPEDLLPDASAEEILAHVVAEHHPRLALACSFQKEEAVLLDLLLAVEPEARVFTLDTGVLFEETYETWRTIEDRYGIQIESFSGMTLEEQAAEYGDRLWEREPDRCCGIRKVAPLKQALSTVDAWITGMRRDQSPTRANAPKLGWDKAHGIWKASPLAEWTDRDVWRYIADHGLPYNPLHDQGYSSIGCTHCTRPGSGREGRWAGQEKIECGLHDGEAAGQVAAGRPDPDAASAGAEVGAS
jgi:phosphoadenosine phosphosulfate reductase